MPFQTMSNIGQVFAMELERQARRIVEGEEIVGGELEQLNTPLTSWMEEVRRLQEKPEQKVKQPSERITIGLTFMNR